MNVSNWLLFITFIIMASLAGFYPRLKILFYGDWTERMRWSGISAISIGLLGIIDISISVAFNSEPTWWNFIVWEIPLFAVYAIMNSAVANWFDNHEDGAKNCQYLYSDADTVYPWMKIWVSGIVFGIWCICVAIYWIFVGAYAIEGCIVNLFIKLHLYW